MFIRRVLKLSSSLKNVPLASQNVFAYHLSHVEKLKDTGDTQEHAEEYKNKLALDLKAGSLPKVLITLQNNKDVLQGSHITTAMSTCYHLMKKEASSITRDHTEPISIEWKEHLFFKEMSEIIHSNIKKLSGSEAVQILYYTRKLKGTSKVHEALLNHIHKNVKDLSLDDFRIILSLFKHFKHAEKSTYLANVKKALLKDFIMRVSINYRKNDIFYLSDGLYFLSCISNKLHDKFIDLFVEDLCNFKYDIPLERALIILEALCSLKYLPKKSSELIEKIEEIIIDNINAVQSTQIVYIVHSIKEQIKPAAGMQEFYNANFIDKLIQKFISEDPGFESSLSMVKNLIDMRHYNVEILNYVCASYFEKISMRNQHIKKHNAKLVLLISGLAHANYKSMFWPEIENHIMTEESLLDYNHETLCILALNALCLDFYPIRILQKLFDDTYDFSKNNFLHWTFSKIHQIIRTNQSYEGPRLTESQIQSLKTMIEKTIRVKTNVSLLPYLEEGIGDPTCVKTNLSSKLFHKIDHIVAYDKDDLPIPLNNNALESNDKTKEKIQDVEYIENLKVPQGSKIIAVMFTPSSWYFRNTKALMGPYKILFTTLEKMNYNVVNIATNAWKETPDREKASFLQSAIKSKLETARITT